VPEYYPEESTEHSEHSESLKSRRGERMIFQNMFIFGFSAENVGE